jgi:hypothetical protein
MKHKLVPIVIAPEQEALVEPEEENYVSTTMLDHYTASCRENRKRVVERQNILVEPIRLSKSSYDHFGILVTSQTKRHYQESYKDELLKLNSPRSRSSSISCIDEGRKLPKLDLSSVRNQISIEEQLPENSKFGCRKLPPIKREARPRSKTEIIHFPKPKISETKETEQFIREFNLTREPSKRTVLTLPKMGKETLAGRDSMMYLEQSIVT